MLKTAGIFAEDLWRREGAVLFRRRKREESQRKCVGKVEVLKIFMRVIFGSRGRMKVLDAWLNCWLIGEMIVDQLMESNLSTQQHTAATRSRTLADYLVVSLS